MTNELASFVLALPCGFITDPAQLAELVRLDPHGLVLLRCGMGRFLCPAQDIAHFRGIIEKEGSDYVRDVSVYPPTLAMARHHIEAEAKPGEGLPAWHLAAEAAPAPKVEPLPPLKYGPAPGCAELLLKHKVALDEAALQAKPQTRLETISDRVVFDESQCGGVFDGNSVQSDADPGL